MADPVEVVEGEGPMILAMPHAGLHVPDEFASAMNDAGKTLGDTDWHVNRLYQGILPGATTVRATFHRYVIDANRDPSGESLYPGQNTTGLCPSTDFDGRPIWRQGREPNAEQIEARRRKSHAPYHDALKAQIDRLLARHGTAVLYDCHSIRSRIPFRFDGVLPDLNVGDNGDSSCASAVAEAVHAVCVAAEGYTSVLNGRFKGGWTTRHYGDPDGRVHAIQMELAQAIYLDSETPPFAYSESRAARLRPHLAAILARLEQLALSGTLP